MESPTSSSPMTSFFRSVVKLQRPSPVGAPDPRRFDLRLDFEDAEEDFVRARRRDADEFFFFTTSKTPA
jgi:hypothetical protein